MNEDELCVIYKNPLFSSSMCRLCGDETCFYKQQIKKDNFLLTVKQNIELLNQPYILDDVSLSSVVVFDKTYNTFYVPDEEEAMYELNLTQEMLENALKDNYDDVVDLSKHTLDLSIKIDYYNNLLQAYDLNGIIESNGARVRIAYIKEDLFDDCMLYINATPSIFDVELLKRKNITVKRDPMLLSNNVRVLQLNERKNSKHT
ncbi:MAG: hypothetical protein SYNGOMJ08_00579 [Candidatus Syntrophoarchaeum sp. GoM_oil]|nr:MAG: hypothetical protein SYNGOMJ08_00579 [Candidatus Syntrophoarchaeum sp. GoM_oil]